MDNMKYLLLLAFAISVSSRRVFDVEAEVFEISGSIHRVEDVDEKVVLQEEWNLFKKEHSKVYKDSTEELFRKKIFLENKRRVIQHNQLYELGQVSFKLGLNQFSDLQNDEFVAAMCGSSYNSSNDIFSELKSGASTFIGTDFAVPESVDWRQKGAVTNVKMQDQENKKCASCWAFAATGVLEGYHFRKSGQLVSLSEQNLLDCSGGYINQGCANGSTVVALSIIQNNCGIDTENSYPYKASVGPECLYNSSNSGATVEAYGFTEEGNENELKEAVATFGPIAARMDASIPSFQLHEEGVYYDSQCSSDRFQLNHAVLVVGYGTSTNGTDYWIVKNSWGTKWGEKGYFLLARNRGNSCGIATDALFLTYYVYGS